MYCNKCGNKLEDDMKFCNKCGNSVVTNNVENVSYNKDIKIEENKKKITWKKVFVISLATTIILLIFSPFADNRFFSYLFAISAGITALLFYFIPTFVATEKKHRNEGAIGVLNFFVGWTFIGWVVCLVWALSSQKPLEVSNTNYSTTNKYDDLNKLQELKESGAIT